MSVTTHRPGGIDATTSQIDGESKTMRRITGGLALLFGLSAIAFVFCLHAGNDNQVQAASFDAEQIADGKQLYQTACITCHGANLQGVLDRGPSLVGVGQAATYFQVSSGRMPAAENGAQIQRKEPVFNPDEDRRAGRVHPGQRRRPGRSRTATCAQRPDLPGR